MNSVVKDNSGCWIWTGCKKECGAGMIYGNFYFNKRNEYAHRASYILNKGSIPKGLQVNHKCDIPLCVNPEHLYIGTQQDNMNDVRERNRRKDVPKRFGELNNNSKITQKIANDIQEYYVAKVFTQQELADMYGISQNRVSKIINTQYLITDN